MNSLNLFIPIQKIDEEQRLVYGQVAAEVLDNSGEMFDYEASKPYFEKWSANAEVTSGGKSKGNLRVMHTSKVAGIVTDLGFNDDDRIINACSKVIDDAEWEMVKAGGYTGFSMGGRYVNRVKKDDGITRYTADPVEISLVDKPCIPTATFSVVKADGIVEEHRFRDDLYLAKGEQERDERGRFASSGGGGSEGFKAYGQDVPAEHVAETKSWIAAGADHTTAPAHLGTSQYAGTSKGSAYSDKELASIRGSNHAAAVAYAERVVGSSGGHDSAVREVSQGIADHAAGGARKSEDQTDLAKADDADKPYGDVKYADPGYQSDGDKRYPIDTEAHIRSAWSYVNQSKNADKYSAKQLSEIKGRIEAAWKKTIDKDGPPSAEKADHGDNRMYVPTNDEMLPVARALAKADGKDEATAWIDYMDAARVELLSKHDTGQAPASQEPPVTETPVQPETAEKGDRPNPFADKGKDDKKGDKADDSKGSDDAKDSKDGEDGDNKDAKDKKTKEATKADTPELQQGWLAKDGSFHLKKADAVAHNATLDGPAAEPTASDKVAALIEKADKIAAGETGEEPEPVAVALTKADVIAVITEPLAKLTEFLGSDVLAKGMYDVRRLADVVSAVSDLHCSLAWDAEYEGDASPLPGQLLEHLKGLGATLIALATEEVNELIENASKYGATDDSPVPTIPYDDGMMELAASTLGLEKAVLVASTQERLAKRDPAAPADALAKLADADRRAADALAKAEKAETELAKVTGLIGSLEEKIEKVLKMPQPKAPTTVVSKGAEPTPGAAPLDLSKFTPDQLANAAIRMSQQNGQRIGIPAPGS